MDSRRRRAWRYARPFMLAAAAATSWLALSAPAATADSPENGSLLKSVTSSVATLTTSATNPLADVVLPEAGAATVVPSADHPAALPSPALGSVVGGITHGADQLLQSAPVVPALVPADTLTALTSPVIGAADTVVGSTTQAVLPLVTDVVHVANPVLQPVLGLVTVPEQPAMPGGLPPVPGLVEGDHGITPVEIQAVNLAVGAAHGLDAANVSVVAHVGDAAAPTPRQSITEFLGNHQGASWTERHELAPSAEAGPAHQPGGQPADSPPYAPPAVPGSGPAGAGGSAGGPQTPAWLMAHHFDILRPSTVSGHGALLQAPAPVSFDPGSSPD